MHEMNEIHPLQKQKNNILQKRLAKIKSHQYNFILVCRSAFQEQYSINVGAFAS